MEYNNNELVSYEFLLLIWRNKLIIIGAFIVFAIGFYFVSDKYIDKEYASTSQVNVSTVDNDKNTVKTSPATFVEFAKRRESVEDALNELNLKIEYEKFKDNIIVTSVSSEVISITVKYNDPLIASKIANKLADIFISTAPVQFNDIESCWVLEYSVKSTEAIYPNIPLFTLIGALLGLICSTSFVLIRELSNNKIRTPKEVSKYLNLRVIGELPK